MKILTVYIYTELTLINPLSAHHKQSRMLSSSAEIFEASLAKSVDPYQTAPVGAA